jgi:hypothetical protein
MKWIEIRHKFPGKFILLGNIEEKRIREDCFQVMGGDILLVTDDPQMVLKAYKKHKTKGEDVLYSLPSTPDEFMVEEKAFLGMLS